MRCCSTASLPAKRPSFRSPSPPESLRQSCEKCSIPPKPKTQLRQTGERRRKAKGKSRVEGEGRKAKVRKPALSPFAFRLEPYFRLSPFASFSPVFLVFVV